MTDLLPCPFCGGADVEAESTSAYAFVCCNNCGAEAEVQSTIDSAVELWNTRTPPPGYALVRLEGAEERVARAIVANFYKNSAHMADRDFVERRWENWLPEARAAIRAMTEGE